jgi:hypothetical protein
MKRLTLIALILLFATSCLNAQKKEIAQARSYIKSGQNLDKAEQLMTDLLKKPENKQNIKLYLLAFQAMRKQYDVQNEKLYLKQSYDTVALFNAIYRMFSILESLDSIEASPNKKGKVNVRYRKKHSEFLDTYRMNLYYGGNFFVRRHDYKTASVFYRTYLDCSVQPLFSDFKYADNDLNMPIVAYWAVYSGYKLNDAQAVLDNVGLAFSDTAMSDNILQYQTEAYKWLNDTSNYVATLKIGFKRYPQFPFFFSRLMDYYNTTNQTNLALATADSALAINDTLLLFNFAKSTALLNAGRYKECIAASDSLIAKNDSLADAYYNAGTAWLNQAFDLENSSHSREKRFLIRDCYTKARPYMEKYRCLAPNEVDKWGPGLYRIYLNLNMGKHFDEIDKLLNKKISSISK